MQDKIALSALLPAEICETLSLAPAFRANQIFHWISRGISSFEDMANLPRALRSELSERALIRTARLEQKLEGTDGTIKLLLRLADGLSVETVLLTDAKGRKTACVSSQTGCPMGCAFCRTGQLGAGRNLSAGEIVEQFFFLEEIAGTLDNIVFMGMGEPMLNLAAVRKTIEVLCDERGRALSRRRITISTSGLTAGIYELADRGPAVRLAVSLTTADEELRTRLMPVNKSNPLPELKKAIDYYGKKSGKRCTLEAALLAGVNTGAEETEKLIRFASDLNVLVNLIPWNPVAGLSFKTPSRAECERVRKRLEEAGIKATLRMHRGGSVAGACGQLGGTRAAQDTASAKENT